MGRLSPEERAAAKMKFARLLAEARAYCAKHKDGGSLHVVLEDGNVEDHCLEFSLRHAVEVGDHEGEELAKALATLTIEQRARLVDAR